MATHITFQITKILHVALMDIQCSGLQMDIEKKLCYDGVGLQMSGFVSIIVMYFEEVCWSF